MKLACLQLLLSASIFLVACQKDISNEKAGTAIGLNADNNLLSSNGAPALFMSGDKNFYVINALSGGRIFDYQKLLTHPSIHIQKAPAIKDSLMIIPASNKLFCINYRTKAILWETRFDVQGEDSRNYRNSELCMNSNTIFIAYADYQSPYGLFRHASKFFAVDISTGSIKWVIDLLQLGYDYDNFGNPTCTEQTVYLPVRNKLFAYDTQSGTLKWQFASGGSFPGNLSNPAYSNGKIFVACRSLGSSTTDSMFALDLNSGIKLWGRQVGLNVNPTPVPYKDEVFVNINTNIPPLIGGVLCMDAATGNNIWEYTRQFSFPYASGMCPVFISDDMLFVSEEGHATVYRLNIETGEKIWSVAITSIFSGNQDEGPLVSGGAVYFKTTMGDVYALNVTDGSQVWKTHITATNINTGPVFVNASGIPLYTSESGMQQ